MLPWAFSVKPQEQMCSLGVRANWVTEECLRNLSLEGTVPNFTRSWAQLACSKILFSSEKEKRQHNRAEGTNIMRTWCRTNQVVLQGFTLRVVLNVGARGKCLDGNEGMKVEINM